MPIRFYNSLSRSLEDFVPQDKSLVTFYSCGPTVYNFAHIGNMRAYVFADTVKRALLYAGYQVRHVMNYTDIEDKIIRDAVAKGVGYKQLTEPFIEAFQQDRAAVNILPATVYTKATDYIDDMVALIEKLIANGFAYKADDGSVYFDLAKDTAYGKLVTLDKDSLKANAKGRMKSDEYDKDNVQDFALWKAWDAADGDIYWDTPLGRGRPGWHIECSAMAIKELGETIDIHTGGVDNKFPHHENEIAQSECATGHVFANYFMHNEHVLVDGKKMSKSLGNFYTLRDLEERGFNIMSYRYWLLTSHYRTQVNFSLETLEASQTAYKRLINIMKDLSSYNNEGDPAFSNEPIQEELTRFENALFSDLGTPECLSILWEVVGSEKYSKSQKHRTLMRFDEALGLGIATITADEIPQQLFELANERASAKNAKDFSRADEIRTQIEQQGYGIKDTEAGPRLYKL